MPWLSIFRFQLPIKEVYLGLRNKIPDDLNQIEPIEGAKFFRFEMDDRSWDLKAKKRGSTHLSFILS